MASIMITHSLADLDALPTEEDRAKARGFIDRCAITVLAALPPRELDQVSQITPLTGPERHLVACWSAPDSWRPGARHPGRGKYLIKTGGRIGIAFDLGLVGDEPDLYDTDQAIRAPRRPSRGARGEPRARPPHPVRRRQHRRRLGRARLLLGAGDAGRAGLGKCAGRRRGVRRARGAVRHQIRLRRPARPHPRRLAAHPHPGRRGHRRDADRCGRRGGRGGVAGRWPARPSARWTRSPRWPATPASGR